MGTDTDRDNDWIEIRPTWIGVYSRDAETDRDKLNYDESSQV